MAPMCLLALNEEKEISPMRITINYWAQARQATGRASEQVELSGPPSIGELLGHLAQSHGDPLRRLVLNGDGMPHPSILLFIGEDQVAADGGRVLHPGEVLNILPPIAGGWAEEDPY